MAHFAQLDNDNNVLAVIVVNNEDILDSNGSESEEVGIAFCKELFGDDTIWVQSSYNNTFRKQLAMTTGTYNPTADVFVEPCPFPSWSLDANNDWQAPTSYPEDGNTYAWNEETLSWDLSETHQAKILVAVDGEVANP